MSNPSFYELTPVMKEVLENEGKLKMKPGGISMLPFIREYKDEVILRKLTMPLKKGRIYLFQREDGKLVLHRLVRIHNEELIFRGDNQLRAERVNSSSMLIAEVHSVQRGNKSICDGSFWFVFYRIIALPFCFTKKVLRRLRKRIGRIIFDK